MKRITHIVIMAVFMVGLIIPLSAMTVFAQPPCTPVFYITNVVADQNVTIQAYNFPPNLTLQVLMGSYGSLGIGGTLVTTVSSGSTGSFQGTYTIPATLHGSQQIAIRLQEPTGIAYAYNWFWNDTAASAYGPGYYGFPITTITGVNVDSNVTMSISNLPANTTFNVLMGAYGTYGVNGIQVGTFNSGSGGTMSVTYNIPSGLVGSAQIAVRIQTANCSLFSYNWFWNNTSGSSSGSTTTSPYVTVTGVAVDSAVSLHGYNFPANHTFNLYMGPYATMGSGGTYVTFFTTGTGGEWTATFSIPSGLVGQQAIGIRLASTTDGYVVTNWFWNNTTNPQPIVYPCPGQPVPNITIAAVAQNSTVTVSAVNFPANTNFVVLMGAYGTLGIGGTQVASFNSGSGGSFSATYSLPSSVIGMSQVAIRIQSTSGYFFAYNWFWNYTAG